MNPDWAKMLGIPTRAPGEPSAAELFRIMQMMKDSGWMDEAAVSKPVEPGVNWDDIGDELEELKDFELEIDRMTPEELLRAWRSQNLTADPERITYMLKAVQTLSEDYPDEYAAAHEKVGFDSTTLLAKNEVTPFGA